MCTAGGWYKVTSAQASTQVADQRSSRIAAMNSPPHQPPSAGAQIPLWPSPSLLQPAGSRRPSHRLAQAAASSCHHLPPPPPPPALSPPPPAVSARAAVRAAARTLAAPAGAPSCRDVGQVGPGPRRRSRIGRAFAARRCPACSRRGPAGWHGAWLSCAAAAASSSQGEPAIDVFTTCSSSPLKGVWRQGHSCSCAPVGVVPVVNLKMSSCLGGFCP